MRGDFERQRGNALKTAKACTEFELKYAVSASLKVCNFHAKISRLICNECRPLDAIKHKDDLPLLLVKSSVR